MATTVRDNAFADLQREIVMTRETLARIPDDKLNWRPHERSYSLGGLGTHIANLPTWLLWALKRDGFDFASQPPRATELTSRSQILETFDRNAAAVEEAFGEIDDDGLAGIWTLKHGDRVLSADPKSYVFRVSGISHLVHHRAQLSVYLRLLDVPVPAIYGPSADES
jgi:uncharacterized damage-inducible protein DinB